MLQANEQHRYKAKDCHVAIVVYHLVSVPNDNSDQALICAWGFLHACNLA